jgi:hypothetical protein
MIVKTNPTFKLALCMFFKLCHLSTQKPVFLVGLPLSLCCCFRALSIGIQPVKLHLFRQHEIITLIGRRSLTVIEGRLRHGRPGIFVYLMGVCGRPVRMMGSHLQARYCIVDPRGCRGLEVRPRLVVSGCLKDSPLFFAMIILHLFYICF